VTALTDRSVRSILASLREFGYSDLTEQQVRDSSTRMLAQEKPTDIIDMFVSRMLREAGVLPEEA
jgi:hypothetical protein